MFRRETVHSHFFVHFSPFPVFSAPHRVVCTLHRRFFRASGARCGGVFSSLCRAVRSPAASPCAFRFVTKGEVRHRRELACGVWKGGCPSFLFPLESRKKPCHPGENVEQNAAGDPGRKRERTRRERQVILPSRRLFAPQAKINAETPCFVVTIH